MKKPTLLFWVAIAGLWLISACIGPREIGLFDGSVSTFRSETDGENYLLKTGDFLFVDMPQLPVMNAPENAGTNNSAAEIAFGKQYAVRSDSTVALPVVGAVKVAGLKLADAERAISEAYAKVVRTGDLRVELAFFSFVVLGEVNKQGTYEIRRRRVSLPEAIGLAGGFSFEADREEIQIVRKRGTKTQVYTVSMNDRSLLESDLYYIEPQDVITVRRLKASFADAKQQPLVSTIQLTLSIVSSVLVIWALLQK